MATARVSFATPPSTDWGESSFPSPAVAPEPVASSDETTPGELSQLKAILNDTAHLVVAPERLTGGEQVLARNSMFKIPFATLDEASQSPRNVDVRRIPFSKSQSTLAIAKLIQVWKDLKHPNVLGLLGYTLKHQTEIDQLISPYMINGNVRDFLNQAPVGVAQRLEFVRDMAAGLEYLHRQRPPLCHGSLDPRNVLIDENFSAVLTDFKVDNLYIGPWGDSRYSSPEWMLGNSEIVASDVWAWGCVAFEILTDMPPFNKAKNIFYSIIKREDPGQRGKILELVPDAPKPEYASTLRLLHSYLPLCWEYEPKKRPPISLLRHQVFMFSFEDDAGDSVVATLEELAYLLIPPDRLRIIEHSKLGEGNYGEVVLGTLDEALSTPRDVAVKRLKAVGTRGERVRLAKRLARELNIWAKIKHPNVVELIGYYLDEKYEAPLLISALMTNGNVLDYIGRYNPDTVRRIAFVKGITVGLACLHNFDPAICHADLKPANVLVDLHMNAVLCDFGLASFVSGSGDLPGLITTTSLKGTPRYMSPELLLNSDCKHNLESDVWAWACTVFQVLTNRIPYTEISGDAQFFLAMDRKELPGDVVLLLPNDAEVVDSESALTLRFLSSILPQCWDFDPHSRPSICALLSQLFDPSPQPGAEANVSKDVASDDTQAQQVLFDPSSRQETSFNGDEDLASGGSEEGTKLAETPEDPSGNCAGIKSAQEDKQDIPTVAHPEAEVANETNPMVGQAVSTVNALLSQLSDSSPKPGAETSESKDVASGDTQARHVLSDPPSRQESSFNGDEDLVSGGSEEGTKLAETPEDPSGNCAGIKSAQEDQQDIPAVAHPEGEVVNETNPMVGQARSAIKGDVDREAQLEEGDPKTASITSDRSSLQISAQTLILVVVCILSLSANMFFILVLRKVDPLPLRDQEATRASYQERDL